MNDTNVIQISQFIPPSYKTMPSSYRHNVSKAEYQKYIDVYTHATEYECLKIDYTSDNLTVVGFIAKPKHTSKKYPLVIYNRGGCGEDGKIDILTVIDQFFPLVKAGYIVLASQYRGNDGGQGKDECGGNEVHDILNLIKVAHTLDYADIHTIFMLGFSRGGMMTYQALKERAPVRAAAVIAGISDMFLFAQMRPDAEKKILSKVIPQLKVNKHHEYAKRSATHWVEDLNTPLLLIHNDRDPVVHVEQSKILADLLKKHHKPYKLVIYSDTTHALGKQYTKAQKEIVLWFKKYSTSKNHLARKN
jgi:dipeptidyl aminopeptidase/acylaminoacyl peptidase